MAMAGTGGRGKLQSDINVTPLVDVCLVLLIIFMVVTPMLQKGISVQLPETNDPGKLPETANQKLISVEWGEPPRYHVEQKWLPAADFQTNLDEMYQRSPQTELVIKADRRLKYGEVKKVMRMTKDAGFQDVGLISEKKDKPAS